MVFRVQSFEFVSKELFHSMKLFEIMMELFWLGCVPIS